MCGFGAYAGSPDPRPPTGDDKTPPRPSEGGGGSKSVSPPPGQGETPCPQGQEEALESPKLGGEGDPITISDESGDGPHLTGGHATDKWVKIPQVEGWTPWLIGLHTVEEEKKKKNEEEQRKSKEEERKKEEDGEEQRRQQQQLEKELEQHQQQEL